MVPYLEWVVLVNVRSSIDDARGTLGDDGDRPAFCCIIQVKLCQRVGHFHFRNDKHNIK